MEDRRPGPHVKCQQISIRWKILKQQQNAWMTKQGIQLFTAPMRNYNPKKEETEDSGSDSDTLTHFPPVWPLFPTAELIRPINNKHMAHFLPQLNKKLNQYRISSDPLILFAVSECALSYNVTVLTRPVARYRLMNSATPAQVVHMNHVLNYILDSSDNLL